MCRKNRANSDFAPFQKAQPPLSGAARSKACLFASYHSCTVGFQQKKGREVLSGALLCIHMKPISGLMGGGGGLLQFLDVVHFGQNSIRLKKGGSLAVLATLLTEVGKREYFMCQKKNVHKMANVPDTVVAA